ALSAGVAGTYVVSGLAMGFLAAMFGIGGGILLVPILVTVLDYDLRLAAGTSLAVMVPTALLGAVRLTRPGLTSWSRGVRFGVGGVVGALLGAWLGLRLPVAVLTWVFAAVLVATAVQMVRTGWRTRHLHGGRAA
ncbi:MAG: TSUP family transporter, partial [Candidatus Nanopelagicales bacterium]